VVVVALSLILGECCGVLGGPHRAANQTLGNDIPSSWFRLRLDSCHRSPVARCPLPVARRLLTVDR
jgi:hypothetical protein